MSLLSPGSSSPLSAGSDSDDENSADDDPADSGDEEPAASSDEDTAEPTPPVGMCLELSYVEDEWHDVFVHSYDEDGSAWFIDAELGPDGNVNKEEDLNLFFEDITYHEMVQCSKAGCSENYQPIISRCQNCKAKLKSSFARKDWVPPVGK